MIHECIDGGNIPVPPTTETVFLVTKLLHQGSGTTRISGSLVYTCGGESVLTVQIYQGDDATGNLVWQSPDYPSAGSGKNLLIPVDYHDSTGYLSSASGGRYCLTVLNDNAGPLGDTGNVASFCVDVQTIP